MIAGQHLLGMRGMSAEHIHGLLDTAVGMKEISRRPIKKVPALRFAEISADGSAEPSSAIRDRVVAARERQRARFRKVRGERVWANAHMSTRHVRAFCKVDDDCKRRLEEAMSRLGLSARAYTRILKVARTIADLAGRDQIARPDVAEAVRYRSLDRAYWGA